jgi:hypothetical protein
MMRTSNFSGHVRLAGLVLAASTGLLSCSSNSGTGGFGGGFNTGGTPSQSQGGTSTGESDNSSSGGSSQTGSSNAGGSSGTGGATSSGGNGSGGTTSGGGGSGGSSSGSSSNTADASASSGDGGDVIPTAPGITVGPTGATDLAPPPSSVGMQFETPPGEFQVTPGDEIFPNWCVVVPTAIQVGGFQSWMSEGSSHHFILYRGGAVAAGTAAGMCSLGANDWMYASSTPGQVVTENFPANVGLSVAANTQLILNLHFINPSSTTMEPQVKINLLYAKNVMYQAGTMVSFNTSIDIPAATSAGPGTQTVSGTCTAPTGANFFTMSTHTHKHATAAWVDYVHDGTSTEIVHTGTETTYPTDQEPGSGTDWEHPGVGLWTAPNFLTVQAGDSFTYHCSYSNTASTAVTVGETACCNEMCMAIGYYFPAGAASCD